MLRNSLCMAVAVALLAGSASAGVTFFSFGSGAPTVTTVTDFTGDNSGDQPTTAAPGYAWAPGGTATIFGGSVSGLGAEPATSGSTFHTGNYLVVQNGQSITLTVLQLDIKDIFVYVGSLDTYNSISFGGPGVSYTGAQLGLISGQSDGSQPGAKTNGLFEFSFSSDVTSVTFTSSGNSFEIADIGAAVPEPAAWALMLAGFGALGAALRTRRGPIAA